jgi:hypothetical protein
MTRYGISVKWSPLAPFEYLDHDLHIREKALFSVHYLFFAKVGAEIPNE